MLKPSRELWDYYLRSIIGMQRAQTQAGTLLSWRWLVSDWLHALAKEVTSVGTSPLEITRGCVSQFQYIKCAQTTLVCASAGTEVQCLYFSNILLSKKDGDILNSFLEMIFCRWEFPVQTKLVLCSTSTKNVAQTVSQFSYVDSRITVPMNVSWNYLIY